MRGSVAWVAWVVLEGRVQVSVGAWVEASAEVTRAATRAVLAPTEAAAAVLVLLEVLAPGLEAGWVVSWVVVLRVVPRAVLALAAWVDSGDTVVVHLGSKVVPLELVGSVVALQVVHQATPAHQDPATVLQALQLHPPPQLTQQPPLRPPHLAQPQPPLPRLTPARAQAVADTVLQLLLQLPRQTAHLVLQVLAMAASRSVKSLDGSRGRGEKKRRFVYRHSFHAGNILRQN